MLRLQELARSSVCVERNVVISLDGQTGSRFGSGAANKLKKRYLDLKDVAEGGCGGAVTGITIDLCHMRTPCSPTCQPALPGGRASHPN